MGSKKILIQSLTTFLIFVQFFMYALVANASTFNVSGAVLPGDVTNLAAADFAPGTGEVILTWTTSPTPNVTIQRLEITGPQGPGVNFSSQDLVPFPGPSTGDNYTNYNAGNNITGLVIGETYIFRIVSVGGAGLESPGAAPGALIFFIPSAALPAPVLLPEPTVTQGTSNTLYWTNGGVDDPALECRITSSLNDFNLDPLATIDQDSGWVPCPSSATTYNYTFSGLTPGVLYFYHVQSRHPVDGLSPYSNVEMSLQDSGGGGGGGHETNPPQCGNGLLESGEQCDDGNRTPGDGCNAFCSIEPAVCGNGTLESGEECDDGNTTSGDGCSNICENEGVVSPAQPVCGNAIIETPEECDDGNTTAGDGCSSTCTIETAPVCGNGTLESGEECDDGNTINGDGCSNICVVEHAAAPECGNGTTESPEECDDGNLTSGDGCSATCTLEAAPVCGNAVVEIPEECDDGNTVSGDGCSNICETEILPACGNGILEAPEECDDGNLTNYDGCSDICEEEEIVTVYLHILGEPEHRMTNYYDNFPDGGGQEESLVNFGAADSFRINNTPNLGLISQLMLYKPSVGSLDSVNTTLDNFGEGWVAVDVIAGTYDFALNGEAHNNRVLKNIVLDATVDEQIVELDFTKAQTQKLVAGDTYDDNYINALDIATMLGSYKTTGANKNDLNKDESPIVNAIDIAILIWNYKKSGEAL